MASPHRPAQRRRAARHLPPLCALICAVAVAARGGGADEALVPLATVEPAEAAGRADPMRPAQLSAAERERLYEQAARDAEQLDVQSRQLRRLTRLLQPAVVHIDARKPALKPKNGRAVDAETGSGVIVEIAGRTVVLTNRHVVDRSPLESIALRLHDRRELRPVRLWSDAGTDLAVLEIEAPDLVCARLAAADTVEIGDSVLAIGSPFGLPHSITLGIVSAKGRRDLELGAGIVKFQDFIQSDAAINPGNSGGPLVNMRGEVVGINTCIASNSGGFEGLGFAIPVGLVTFVARQLVEHGTVGRGFLGVGLDKEFTQADAHRLGMERPVGARIENVTAASPAEAAGIRRDDVVLELDGRAIEDDDHLLYLLSTTPAESTVDLVIFRDGERLPMRITVASRASFGP